MKAFIIIIICLGIGWYFLAPGDSGVIRDAKVKVAEVTVISDESGIVKTWQGTGSKTLKYTVGKVPLKMVATYSSIGANTQPFRVGIEREIASGLTVMLYGSIITETGQYQFLVDAQNYKWEIKLKD